MSALPWILGGGVAAAGAYLLIRERSSKLGPEPQKPQDAAPLVGRWVWPMGTWKGRKPEISDGFTGTRHAPQTGEAIRHGGVDIMYRRVAGDAWAAGTPNGSRNFVLPEHRAALAASDGLVWSASYTPRGWTVVIDHGPRKVATYYTHMSQLLVVAKQSVRPGQPIGIVGADPLDAAHLKHLHFEVWRGGPNDRVDPEPLMKSWEHLPDPGDLPEMLLARNARKRIEHAPGERFIVRQHTRSYPRR